jgi:hypothetical protein
MLLGIIQADSCTLLGPILDQDRMKNQKEDPIVKGGLHGMMGVTNDKLNRQRRG